MTVAVLMCYMGENTLVDVVAPRLSAEGADVHLWAVQRVRPDVARWTRGIGSFHKPVALNKLLASCNDPDYLLCADDDLAFPDGFLSEFLRVVEELRFDLAQPALTVSSHWSFPDTVVRQGLLAREVNVCEQMCFLVSRRLRKLITPFPEDFYMGWGLEALWERVLLEQRWTAGIVDATVIRHELRPIGVNYSTVEAWQGFLEKEQRLGFEWAGIRVLRAYARDGGLLDSVLSPWAAALIEQLDVQTVFQELARLRSPHDRGVYMKLLAPYGGLRASLPRSPALRQVADAVAAIVESNAVAGKAVFVSMRSSLLSLSEADLTAALLDLVSFFHRQVAQRDRHRVGGDPTA
jgi:hypothetical protein